MNEHVSNVVMCFAICHAGCITVYFVGTAASLEGVLAVMAGSSRIVCTGHFGAAHPDRGGALREEGAADAEPGQGALPAATAAGAQRPHHCHP